MRLEISYVLVYLSIQAVAVTFTPGAICDGFDSNPLPMSKRLSGKHLIVNDIVWEPFGIYDKTKTGNDAWTGYDVDMLNLVAKELNITYEIHLKEKLSTTTWDEYMVGVSDQSDLHLNYWMGTPGRRNEVIVGLGHVETSFRVLAFKPVVAERVLIDELVTVFQPFTFGLWAMLIGMVLLAALVQMVLESPCDANEDYARSRHHFDMYITTFWLFSTQITNTNSGAPVTGPGRFFIAFMGFMFVVMLSAYTANLAAFLAAPAPLFSIQKVEDLEYTFLPVCVVTFTPEQNNLIKRFHPNLNLAVHTQSEDEVLSNLRNGTCEAVIIDEATAHPWLRHSENCGIHLVGASVLNRNSGWFTNHHSSCVNIAFGFAIQKIIDDGDNIRLWKKWVPEPKCELKAIVEDDGKLSITQMSSIFALFGTATFIALAAKFHDKGNQMFTGPHRIKDSHTGKELETPIKEADIHQELRGLRQDMSEKHGEMSSQLTMLTAAVFNLSGMDPSDPIPLPGQAALASTRVQRAPCCKLLV